MANPIAEYKEFFIRDRKVATGSVPDQESNFPTTYLVGANQVGNRFLKNHYPSEDIQKKLFYSLCFKLNIDDTASLTVQGLAKIANDTKGISWDDTDTGSMTTFVRPHHLPEVVSGTTVTITPSTYSGTYGSRKRYTANVNLTGLLAGSSNTQILFNDSTTIAGSSKFTFIKGTSTVNLNDGFLALHNSILRLYELVADTNYISILAPTAVTSSYTITLPAAQGGANTVLQNNGVGTLTWVANAATTPAGSDTQIQFNNSGTFGANANFTWNSNILTVVGKVYVNSTTNSTVIANVENTATYNSSIFIGTNVCSDTTGAKDECVIIGINAAKVAGAIDTCTIVGIEAGYDITAAQSVTLYGHSSGANITDSEGHTIVGMNAGSSITTADNTVIIGKDADYGSNTSDVLVIGNPTTNKLVEGSFVAGSQYFGVYGDIRAFTSKGFRTYDDDNSHYSGIKPTGTTTASYQWIMPPAGSPGADRILSINATNNLIYIGPGITGTAIVDNGTNRLTLAFTNGVLTTATVGATAGVLISWS